MTTRNAGLMTLLAAILAILTGCSGSKNDYQGFPCKVKGNDNWGMTSPDGRLTVEDEFKHRPSVATCGRYWAQNERGYWELYKDDGKARTVNDKEYRYVSNFYDGRAIVAERDKPVTIINTDGEEVASLAKVGSVEPDRFSDFADGLAVYATDTLQGVVNFEGEVVVPARYYTVNTPACGRIVAIEDSNMGFYSYDYDMARDSVPESTATVLDYSGKAIFKISSRKYSQINMTYIRGYLPVAVSGKNQDEEPQWGLLGPDGDVVVAPSKANGHITDVVATHYIYEDSENRYGLRTMEGETVIKPKYTMARFIDEKHLAVTRSAFEDGQDMEWEIIDLQGERTVDRKFLEVSPVFGSHLFVKTREDRWAVITPDGEMDDNQPVFTDIYFDVLEPSYMVASDHIDIAKLIEGVGMTADSMDSLTFQSSALQALERQSRYYSSTNKPHPANYSYTNEVNIFPTVEGEMVTATVIFPSNLSHQTYRQEKVIDYVWGNYYWYHLNKIPTGYVFTSDRPSKFSVTFNNYGKLRGKLRTLYNDLVKHFSAYGSVTDHNSAASLIELGAGRTALVALEPNSVKVVWGKLTAADKALYSYDGNREEMSSMFADEDEGDI